jgi:class 3 adenylate cyclase/predicted ATPase
MDVGVWLRSLGLGQYEATFRDNEIDGAVLPKLTVDDLKDLRVAIVGHRRKIMSAIEKLNAESVVRTDVTEALPTQAAPPVSVSPDGAERRPITILFCDLVGSTNLAARLDAEDWRNLVNAYLDEASAAVTDLGGHVLKKLGDGLMALFGYPKAQENDAERAVRAALAIQRALGDLNARNARSGAPELSARIGLESGSVVVDAAGEVFGEAPNVAARVQAAAEPGTVLVTGSVQRQVAGLFVVEEKGAHELKGVAKPISLYRVVRASGGGRRGGGKALTQFVGREEELALLARRWERARAGEGQLVLVVGEPGLGKSRLIEEFHARLAETPHTWVEWRASQLLQNTPLHPIAEWGRQRFGVDAPAEQRLADLENTLRLIGLDPAEQAPLLAPLVDIPLPPGRAAHFPPEELRRRQLAAMTAWVLAGARSQPVVVAFEDLHWADPTSLDLLRAFTDRGAQAPLLVLATTRPEFRAPWSLRSHHSVLSLSPLDRAGVARMVGEISARHALSKEVIEGVSERTGGVPLFVEEVTRLLVERGERGGVQAIPPTLQQSLAARLDRLGPAREVAQVGAVLGRDFVYALLRDVAEIDEPALQASLDRLADADLVFVEGAPPEANYRFKHALIQDAAYESLLKSRRQALHRRAAEILHDQPEHAAEPEAIAHHFTQAGLDDLAIEWWGKAGDQALRRSAFQEAIAHLGKAIAMADKAEGGEAVGRSGQRRQLHVAYGNALIAARGHSAPETMEAFARVRESAPAIGGAPERLAADYSLWVRSFVRGELRVMRGHAATVLGDVEASPDSPEAGVAHRIAGTTHWFAGEYVQAREHLERALALFQPGRDDDLAFRFGQDSGVAAMCFLALTLWPQGATGRAVSLVGEADARIAAHPHVGTQAYGRIFATMFELIRGNLSRARSNAAELAALTRDHDLPMWRPYGVFLEGLVDSQTDAPGGGLEDMRRGLELLREQNVLFLDGPLKIAQAEAEARAGDVGRAVAILDETLATCDRCGYRAFEAELHRARGEMLLRRDPANPGLAEEAFWTAIAVAEQQGTRSFELRAALALAKLYQSTNRPAEAHTVLAPALEGFSPTMEMPEIVEAKTLLSTLLKNDEVKAEAARRQRLTQLHAARGVALFAARGGGAPETTAAFASAREQTFGDEATSERFIADFGLWVGSYVRGELPSMRAHAAAFLNDVASKPASSEVGVAHRTAGITCWFAGEYREARGHLERALALFEPGRDDELTFRFGLDPGIATMVNLANASWPLGEVDRAISLIDRAELRSADITHAGVRAFARMHSALFDLMRRDHVRAAPRASELTRITRDHELTMYGAFGAFLVSWATDAGGAPGDGLGDMRRAVDELREQNVLLFDGLLKVALAEAEARAGDPDRAVALIDEGLATAERTSYRAFEAELYRARGQLLLKRDRADPGPAEEALLTAIAVAKRQGTRSFELRAALALAKLYRATCRDANAHATLGPALQGFSPTPEFPEIAEAQALSDALAETEAVKAASEARKRHISLQVSYGNAMFAARGFAAPETTAAFERARELAGGEADSAERHSINFGLWAGSYVRGELGAMRELSEAFLRDCASRPYSPEAGVAQRILGVTKSFAGEFNEARVHLEKALTIFESEQDDDLAFRFGIDAGVAAMIHAAMVYWPLGEVDLARRSADAMAARLARIGHVATAAYAHTYSAMFEFSRQDRNRAALGASALLNLAQDHEMPQWNAFAKFLRGWTKWQAGDASAGILAMHQAIALLNDQRIALFSPLIKSELAEAETEAGQYAAALATLDQALAESDRSGQRRYDAEIYRNRGEILLKQDPADPAPAEKAFRTSIAIAKEQGARSHLLLASLDLAKLCESTGRSADAHAVLAPALEGFAPTDEMPEIAEAQALLVAIEAGEHVRHE